MRMLSITLLIVALVGCNDPDTPTPGHAAGSKTSAVTTLTEHLFPSVVMDSSTPVLVDFWAPWCPPCRELAPIIESLAQTYAGRLTVAKVNVDQHGALAQRYGVTSIPNLTFFVDGKVVHQTAGLKSEDELAKIIDGILDQQ